MNQAQKTILIVEDEKTLSQALQMKLGKEGFQIELANNGEEALSKLTKGTIDFVVADLLMPVMDGFTFLEKMREQKIQIPVMVLSNLGQPSDLNRLKELGVDDFSPKSTVSLSEIVMHIKGRLGLS
ncbi:MAG: response regulator [Patescibacteria group bacterium]